MGAPRARPKNACSDERSSQVSANQHSPQVGIEAAPRRANRFAFVLHPLTVDYLAKHPRYGWTRHLPRGLVEASAAYMPASRVGRVAGGQSPTTGQPIEGLIYALGATPRQMLSRAPEFTYRRLDQAVRDAASHGAKIVGLGAFTKVVGDAGVTVARRASIPVTTGNSLTIAATLETAKLTARRMGWKDLAHGKAMIVGATGSIGSVCSRLLAAAVGDVVLVSIEPDRLVSLRQKILAETPVAHVELDTSTRRWVGECDLIVTATSAFGQRVLDVSQCKPGAVILDVALPPDISAEEAAVRPDVLVVESGEVLIPGPVDISFDIGLPRGVAYACLAEAALLAMEGRFESFTLGRDVPPDRVKEIYRLFRRHHFQIAPLRSFGQPLTDALVDEKNARAEELRRDPALLERVRAKAAAQIARIPPRAKGVAGVTTLKPQDVPARTH
jgi:predicted amino acid dehydrogenase